MFLMTKDLHWVRKRSSASLSLFQALVWLLNSLSQSKLSLVRKRSRRPYLRLRERRSQNWNSQIYQASPDWSRPWVLATLKRWTRCWTKRLNRQQSNILPALVGLLCSKRQMTVWINCRNPGNSMMSWRSNLRIQVQIRTEIRSTRVLN
jgi:hypothetical protein